MRKPCVIALIFMFIGSSFLNAPVAWPSTTKTIVLVDEESIAGAPAPSTRLKDDRIWDTPRGLGWKHRFFDKPLVTLNFRQRQFRLPNASGIPLKAPGTFPGIEFGVEMNSFQALQQVVPPERLSKSLNSKQNYPLLLSPSLDSPDYNGGFLRFTW